MPSIAYHEGAGRVVDIVRDTFRSTPLAKVLYADSHIGYVLAPEGLRVGDDIQQHILPLSQIKEGTEIFAIEGWPHSGPQLCRSAGSRALLISKTAKECIVMLPSKKKKMLHPTCRAMIGIPAGEGRAEKPWVKAGKKWIAMHRRGKLYPRTSGVAMNAVDHPFGGGYTGLGKHKSVSRHTPPGRKIGAIAPRRMGRKKGKQ